MSESSRVSAAVEVTPAQAHSNPYSNHPSIILASRSTSLDCKIDKERTSTAHTAPADDETGIFEQDMSDLLIDIPPPHLTVNQYFMLLDTVKIARIEASAGCRSAANSFVRVHDNDDIVLRKEICGAKMDFNCSEVIESNNDSNVVPFKEDRFIDQDNGYASASASSASAKAPSADQYGIVELVGDKQQQQQQLEDELFGSDGEDTISGSETGHGADSDSRDTLSSHFSSANEDDSNDADDCSLGCSLAETNGSVDLLLESGSVEFYSDNDDNDCDDNGVYEEHGVYEEQEEVHTDDQQSCDEIAPESVTELVTELTELNELFADEEACTKSDTKLYTTLESSDAADADAAPADDNLDLRCIAKIGFGIEVADVRSSMVMLIASALSPAKDTKIDNCTDTGIRRASPNHTTLTEALDDASVQLRLFDERSESSVEFLDEMELIAEVQQAVDQQLRAEICLPHKQFYTVDEVRLLCNPVMGFLTKAFRGGRSVGGLGVDTSAQIGLSFVARSLRLEMSTGRGCGTNSTSAHSTASSNCNCVGDSYISDIRRDEQERIKW